MTPVMPDSELSLNASKFREDLDKQLRSQRVEFVLPVAANVDRAKEDIARLRREEEGRVRPRRRPVLAPKVGSGSLRVV
jgi:hypothetical protein